MTWAYWNATSTGTTTTTSNMIWVDWCDTASTTMTTTNAVNATWIVWCGQTTSTQFLNTGNPARALTEEQRAAHEAQHRQWQEAAEKERKAREEAEARAEQLLLENLSLKQRAEYAKDKHFVVQREDRRYRIRRGRSGNVDVIDSHGRVSHRLCAHPGEHVPDCDTMLAQKLMLEADDQHFARIANQHPSHDRHAAVLPALH